MYVLLLFIILSLAFACDDRATTVDAICEHQTSWALCKVYILVPKAARCWNTGKWLIGLLSLHNVLFRISSICFSVFLVFFFVWWTGVWTQDLVLTKQHCTAWAISPVPFCSGYFGDGGGSHKLFCPSWSWSMILLTLASQVPRITGVSHWAPFLPPSLSPSFLHWDFFFQYWSLNSGPTPWATPPLFFWWWFSR
jgi:hypothetical protein